jgi:hypothetical protein
MLMKRDSDVHLFDSKFSKSENAVARSNTSFPNRPFIDTENQAETQVNIRHEQQMYKDNENA